MPGRRDSCLPPYQRRSELGTAEGALILLHSLHHRMRNWLKRTTLEAEMDNQKVRLQDSMRKVKDVRYDCLREDLDHGCS